MTAEQFLSFARLFPEPLLLLSVQGQVLAYNAAVITLLRRHPSELQDWPLSALVTTPADQVARYLRDCSATGNFLLGTLTFAPHAGQPALQCRCEGARVRATGPDNTVLLLFRLKPTVEASRSFLLLNQQIRSLREEIRQRQRAEEAERAQREYLQVTLASISDAVIVTTAQGTVASLNPAAETLTGWTTAEATGKPLPEIFPVVNEDTLQPVENPVAKVLRTGAVARLAPHTLLLKKDGSFCPIDDSAAPIRDKEGHLLGIVLVFRDISVHRRAEEGLAQHTRELARANADLRQIAHLTAHDLQEPVRQVGIYTEKLVKRYHDSLDTETNEATNFIVEAAQHMMAQLNDLMHYLEIDESYPGRTLTDCEELLTRVLEHLHPSIVASGAMVTHDPLPTLDANPVHLQLVFHELLDNALKFSGNAPPRVHVWAEREAQSWRFAVRDHGIGIDPQFYGKLFRLFKRLSRDRYAGTGMGLAMCKKIVERHEGGIWLEPTPGSGVTVVFSIRDRKEQR